MINIDGVDVDVSNLDRAIQTIKVQFLYEVILKHAQHMYPKS